MTGHATKAMTEHYSHVESHEKRAAVDLVVAALSPQVERQVEARGDGKTAAG